MGNDWLAINGCSNVVIVSLSLYLSLKSLVSSFPGTMWLSKIDAKRSSTDLNVFKASSDCLLRNLSTA